MISSEGSAPFLAISIAYWLHMLATVAWIGGLVSLILIVLPAAKRVLEANSYTLFLAQIQRRLDPLGWLSLAMLLGTGLFQMSSNPNYQGVLNISSRWASAIFIKHIIFIGMVGVSAYLTWGLLPALRRISLLRAKGQDPEELNNLERRESLLLRLNLVLGIAILGLTALARVS
jgi:uncharacterized membrane protein